MPDGVSWGAMVRKRMFAPRTRLPKGKQRRRERDADVTPGRAQLGSFAFGLSEFGGAIGDFGTLVPFAVGLITVCGLSPAGLLITLGLANLTTGLVFRLPIPIQPMKVLGAMAIAQAWAPTQVYTAALAMGALWLVLGASGTMGLLGRWTPDPVVRGIQIALGVNLGLQGARWIAGEWWLGLAALGLILVFRFMRRFPASIAVVAFGVGVMAVRGHLSGLPGPGLSLPTLTPPDLGLLWPAFRDGGLAQVPLTITNSVIATAILLRRWFPHRPLTERKLALSVGLLNATLPLLGSMPLCHGAGGLAARYHFGARTGGANLIEGTLELVAGLVFSASLAALLVRFPMAVLGAMMLWVGVELAKFGRELRLDWMLAPALATVAGTLAMNIAVGFAAGLAVHYLMYRDPAARRPRYVGHRSP